MDLSTARALVTCLLVISAVGLAQEEWLRGDAHEMLIEASRAGEISVICRGPLATERTRVAIPASVSRGEERILTLDTALGAHVVLDGHVIHLHDSPPAEAPTALARRLLTPDRGLTHSPTDIDPIPVLDVPLGRRRAAVCLAIVDLPGAPAGLARRLVFH